MCFTTASYQLKNVPPPPAPVLQHSNSNPEPERKKPKLEKTKSAQGSIASFFSKPQAAITTQETPAEAARAHWESMPPRNTAPPSRIPT
ncbi:MAG: hypothetical protein M1823_007459, partial [Watsoniomyces obsoletus]